MNEMEEFQFATRNEFHAWLINHHESHPGIWIRFDKQDPLHLIHPEIALDEALCFGWIDGQIRRIDDRFYLKYFTKRAPKSIWSTKNKTSVERLTKEGAMMPSGLMTVEAAKKDGRWARGDEATFEWSIEGMIEILLPHEKAQANYLHMSPSVQRTYALSYYSLKKPESREKRLKIIVDRLENNLPPM